MKKQVIALILAVTILHCGAAVFAADSSTNAAISIEAPSAILIEASSGQVIYEKDAYAHRSPASVTKLMTMLLAAEAVASGRVSLDEPVTASSKAASMGGSQIWLEEKETMSFGEMLKCVTVVSANDCCVAIAEHLAGSEDAFVGQMNARARELGLKDSNFLCCSGLSDSDEHYSCAHDLAIIGAELLKHDFMRDYTTIWMDSIRGGEFGLTNTNKLIYHYPGATGLKTGFTSKAMHCLAASAERDGVEYIAVVLGAPSSSARFESAKNLLNYAFANYTLIHPETQCALPPVGVSLGKIDCVTLVPELNKGIVVEKSHASNLSFHTELPETLRAPITKGQQLGTLVVKNGDAEMCRIPLLAAESVESLGIFEIMGKVMASLLQ